MHLTDELLKQIGDHGFSTTERAHLRCDLAKSLEEAGNYEAARGVLGELWQRIGVRPRLDGLEPRTAALVLLRAGTLSGWIGSKKQIAGAQEFAKDLISESIAAFEATGETTLAREAQTELAYCYWREGALDEARVVLKGVLGQLPTDASDVRILALLRSAIVEASANQLNAALKILNEMAPLVDASSNHSLMGRFHNELATVLRDLSQQEPQEDYLDRALVGYAAASYHFEQAGHTRYRAGVENNLGMLFARLERFAEAHDHLNRARTLFLSLKDCGMVAQVDETRAGVLLAQGRNSDAERVVRSAVHTLQKGGELALLAEALTTHGKALARLERGEQARATLERAVDVGEQAGDPEGAGRAALSLIEELRDLLPEEDLRAFYQRADSLLSNTKHPETLARLRKCARLVVEYRTQTVKRSHTTNRFVHVSEKAAEVVRYAQCVAPLDRPALITGETGTGKEVLARLMHEWSGRRGKFVAINCAALCETLIESQLFGHKKGSFTDAAEDHAGAVRMATGGTLFLDEVGELSQANQAKLLRLIECHEVYPVGATLPERIDVRIIAATNHDLKHDVARGLFRSDLLYRIGAFQIEIPPLRERPEDITALALHFIEEASAARPKSITFSPESLTAIQMLTLRGNARELRTLIERTFLIAPEGAEITAESVQTTMLRQTQKTGFAEVWAGCSLEEEVLAYEGSLIRLALDAAGGHLTRAARLLGISHQRLAFILNGRHRELLAARKPAKKRRQSIIKGVGGESARNGRRRPSGRGRTTVA